jgi:threonine dehydrogenase-like Zn-dependent dehydrogenase
VKAVVWHGPSKVSVDEVDDPTIREPTDAVIQVTATAICGSDLHLYAKGAAMGMLPGDIVGHEPMGIVQAVGSEVTHLRPGDRVVVPFNISCGSCRLCRKGYLSQCETTQNLKGRKGASLFGYTHMYGGVPGGQAEYLRVPQAHFGPIKVDADVPELGALLLSDVLPTAWQAVTYAEIDEGDVVAVYGLGPIGQMCVRMAFHQGASRVLAVDSVPDRLATARAYGAETIDDAEHKDPAQVIEDLTAGLGADRVIDAVGMEAHGSVADRILQTLKLQPDRLIALHHAMASVRRGGTLSVTGVYTGAMQMFPLGDLFDRQVTLRWGQANVRRWSDELLAMLRDGDPLGAADLPTQQVPLAEAPDWYERFQKKEEGVLKVVLRP